MAGSDLARSSGAYRHGVDVGAWVMDPDGAPPVEYLRGAAVAYPLSLLAQALLWRALWADALEGAARAGSIVGLAGHSQGLLAALLVAEDPAVGDSALARHLERAAVQGLHMAAAATGRSPMAAIDGVTLERLQPLLDAEVTVALVNTPTRLVVAGPPATLDALHARLAEVAAREQDERRAGRRGGAPLRFEWTPLGVDVPFHSPALAEPLARFSAWLRRRRRRAAGWAPRARRRAAIRARSQFVEPVRWDAVAARSASSAPTGCSISARARPSRG